MKNKTIISILLVFFSSINTAFTQNYTLKKTKKFSQTYTIKGEKVSGKWDIQVSLPEGYEDTKDIYPVVYILDGQKYFNFAVGRLQPMMESGKMPNSIIIGLNRTGYDNPFFTFGSKEADQFLDFLEKEIFPFMSSNFRVHPNRTIMGWHFTGGFVLHALEKRPELFENYIPSTPVFPGQRTVKDINFDALNKLNLGLDKSKKQLYFGAMSNERRFIPIVTLLDSILQSAPPKNLEWNYRLAEADNDDRFPISVYRFLGLGMKHIYSDYGKSLRFKDLEEFKSKGGLESVKNHFKKRAEKYGGSSEISSGTLYGLIAIASRGGDIQLFDELMVLSKSILETAAKIFTDRTLSFYLKYKMPNKAIKIYKDILVKNPQVIGLYSQIADIYVDNSQNNKAKTNYTKALKLAQEQENEYYITELEKKLLALK